jgi:hypothetical protein
MVAAKFPLTNYLKDGNKFHHSVDNPNLVCQLGCLAFSTKKKLSECYLFIFATVVGKELTVGKLNPLALLY